MTRHARIFETNEFMMRGLEGEERRGKNEEGRVRRVLAWCTSGVATCERL